MDVEGVHAELTGIGLLLLFSAAIELSGATECPPPSEVAAALSGEA